MRLTRIEIKGYKNLTAPVCLEKLGPINIIHGDNNIGKSNLLQAIALMFELLGKPFRYRGIGMMTIPFAEPWAFSAEDWTAQTPEFPAQSIFHLTERQPITLLARVEVEEHEWRAAGLSDLAAHRTVDIAMTVKRTLDRIEAGIDAVRFDDGMELSRTDRDHERIVRDLMRLFTHDDQARPVVRRFALIDARRSIAPALEPPDIWLALYDARDSMDPVHYGRWELFLHIMQRFEDILGAGQFVPTYDRHSKQASLAFQTDRTRIPLELLGSGIQQLAVLIALLLMSNATIVAIEEPELNLRYSLQKRLREVFQDITSAPSGPSQIFITSHSPAFETGPCFYHLQARPDGPVITRRPIADAPMATAHTVDDPGPRGRAPLSYVTSEGLVQLPANIREQLGIEHGGGIVVLKRERHPYVELLTNQQFLDAAGLGGDDDPGDDDPR